MKSSNNGFKNLIWLVVLALVLWGIFIISKPRKHVVRPKAPRPPAAVKIKGKIAIVLDDWGYNLNNVGVACSIKYPITASVLPNLNYSREASVQLHKCGYEIILHLPMEPHGKNNMEKDTILVSMREESIRNILDKDVSELPDLKGVSNHMGSAATEDPVVMKIIFNDLKSKGLYYLDSFVSPKSVCKKTAALTGEFFARRDVFLDNKEDPAYIKQQLNQLKSTAKIKGFAIGIGHDRHNTLLVLKEMLPVLEKEGYKFVYVSELAQ